MSKLIIADVPKFDKQKGTFTRLNEEKRDIIKSRKVIYSRALSLLNKDVKSYKYSNRTKRLAMQLMVAADVVGPSTIVEGSVNSDAEIQSAALLVQRLLTFVIVNDEFDPDIYNFNGKDMEFLIQIADQGSSRKQKIKKRNFENITNDEFEYIRDRILVAIG